MMLAEIQAENLTDLQAAETTVHRFCAQPKHTPANTAFALNSLADWQLKFAQDNEAARRALEKIIELLPDSEFARTAANRIAHLATTEQLVHAREAATVKLKPGVEYLGQLKNQEHLLPKEKGYKQEATELVAHLDAHPLDHQARERLAIIYMRDYGRLDFATEQIEQMIAMPGESPRHVARWLNMLADLQVEATGKTELAEATLRRIIELFPNQSQAQMAEDRIASIALELKKFETTSVVKFHPSESVEKFR
jgi:tetratricopeptide (TPR) repeat protein